ncbi:MAG: TIGR04282 family arsenosugar biosynthesis glycosyltransferase [Verrucomicrobiales bacterium]
MKVAYALMLKAPIPGLVKTRLAADLGDPAMACGIYRLMVERQLKEIQVAAHIHFAPPDQKHLMREWLGSDHQYTAQCEGDLGDRLYYAWEQTPADAVFFLGGDCPAMTYAMLSRCRDLIEKKDVVLVPARDGGYCLLGIRGIDPKPLFTEIPWSTERVLGCTLQRCSANQWSVGLTHYLEDVDDRGSWQRALAAGHLKS